MFSKKSKSRQDHVVHFRAFGGLKFENVPLDASLVVPLWVQCMYRSAQKNSGYITATKFQLMLAIFSFWTKFTDKGYFRTKKDKLV